MRAPLYPKGVPTAARRRNRSVPRDRPCADVLYCETAHAREAPMRFALLALAILLAAATASAADEAASLDKMVEINRKALDELRLGKNVAARDHLIDALV